MESAKAIIEDARALEEAGAFAVVLEAVPYKLAALITNIISVPTIGIGAGPDCDGQVQVINDTFGSYTEFVPKHAKQYAQIADVMRKAVAEYDSDVKAGQFPTNANSYIIDKDVMAELEKEYR